ncbi:recombinase family protein [Jeotgalibacillus terrae]|uniref:Recombinase family protein n=1 Tax=Jeotgalibacillus terrae TaxID=587735 RepID=A0ABW5ZQ11_9BACL|nr:recombinase family protein [Jeotgalibacillus terrae]MBM7581085.1 DNA invertase Pin-like site-specific DNA recombinase [Jeotgalibacillus terrae]
MIIGYIRVSTEDQSLHAQEDAIIKYAQEQGEPYEIYAEKMSSGKNRLELTNALKAVQSGNKFVVYKLDRLARSTKQLYEIAEMLKDKGVEFVSIQDKIDTTTAAGEAMFGMLSVFAQFERSLIQERTKAGLEAARRRGKVGGRPTLSRNTKGSIITLFNQGHSASDIAKEYGIGRSTVYKVIKEYEIGQEG